MGSEVKITKVIGQGDLLSDNKVSGLVKVKVNVTIKKEVRDIGQI